MDALMFLEHSKEKFDIIFLDPPYKKDIIPSIENGVLNVITKNSIIVCETSRNEELPKVYATLPMVFDRHYGDTRVRIYRNAEEEIY